MFSDTCLDVLTCDPRRVPLFVVMETCVVRCEQYSVCGMVCIVSVYCVV